MTAPVAAYIHLPSDTTNTGKKRRTQTRTIGTDSVHEDFVVLSSAREILGNYHGQTGVAAIPAAAQDGTTTGLLWYYNPAGNTAKIGIKKLQIGIAFSASLAADLAVGQLRVQRFTLTGTGSGAARAITNKISSGTSSIANARTAPTGLSITLLDIIMSRLLPTRDSASAGLGVQHPVEYLWEAKEEDEEIILLPGEGVVMYNSVAVTTANRVITTEFSHVEFN